MIRRHPHVFGDVSVKDAEDVVKNWEQIKKEEKAANEDSLLNDVAKSLPGILKAYKYQKKAATVGFDWPDVKPMWEKIHEEIREFQQETEKNEQDRQKMIEEFGDILFALVNVARFYKIDPEEAISVTNVKFYQRFRYMEEAVKKEGKTMNDLSLDELDEYWNKAKEVGL
jgi:tetrapyrrole methylase family protein / MazG family protein